MIDGAGLGGKCFSLAVFSFSRVCFPDCTKECLHLPPTDRYGGACRQELQYGQAEIIPIDLIRIIPAEGCRINTLCVPAASGEAPHCGRSTTCERTDIIPQKHANASYYQQPTDHMPRRYGTGCSLGSRADPSGAHGHSRKRRSRTPCLVAGLPSVRRR